MVPVRSYQCCQPEAVTGTHCNLSTVQPKASTVSYPKLSLVPAGSCHWYQSEAVTDTRPKLSILLVRNCHSYQLEAVTGTSHNLSMVPTRSCHWYQLEAITCTSLKLVLASFYSPCVTSSLVTCRKGKSNANAQTLDLLCHKATLVGGATVGK